ncbi:hypothetical protein AX16_005412 [Volvariella volvacea WC 439]|nr:hypothetical protein AX16_005412 [Volvariella volvacea WC 439]
MLHINELPPEVLARVFEVGVLTSGVTYIPPLCLVCRTWYGIVDSTPRLWGIISIDKLTNLSLLNRQITQAKSSPISLYISSNPTVYPTRRLASLAQNWIYADIPSKIFVACSWNDLRTNLQELRLTGSTDAADYGEDFISQFFAQDETPTKTPPKLRTFAGINLPKHWITPLIGAHTTSLELQHRLAVPSLKEITEHLSRASNIYNLKLSGLRAESYAEDLPTVHLPNLRMLHVNSVEYPGHIVSHIQAPNLQTLIIDSVPHMIMAEDHPLFRQTQDPTLASLSSLFSQWSQPGFLPTNLRNLELTGALQVDDVPYLIRWLSRLPNLLRLTLRDDALGNAAAAPAPTAEERDVLKALASSSPLLCPELLELRIETELVIADLVSIAQARGTNANVEGSLNARGALRYVEAPICPSEGSAEVVDGLRSLVDEVVCGCLGCSFALVTLI